MVYFYNFLFSVVDRSFVKFTNKHALLYACIV